MCSSGVFEQKWSKKEDFPLTTFLSQICVLCIDHSNQCVLADNLNKNEANRRINPRNKILLVQPLSFRNFRICSLQNCPRTGLKYKPKLQNNLFIQSECKCKCYSYKESAQTDSYELVIWLLTDNSSLTNLSSIQIGISKNLS